MFGGEARAEIAGWTRSFMNEGLPAAKAQSMASYELIVQTKKGGHFGRVP
ncbi:hypothetical protein VQ056_26345 [Paenibacillus sp. JTLBN-2024]